MSNEKRGKRRRGVGLVEFALVLPLLLVISLGLVQYGIIMNTTHVLTNIAREGARYAAINAIKDSAGFDATRTYITRVATAASVKSTQLTVVVNTPNGRTIGQQVDVAVTFPMKNKLFLPSSFFGVRIFDQDYTARTSMIIQQGDHPTTNPTFPPAPTSTPVPPPPTPTPLPTPTPTPQGYVPPTPTPVPTATPRPTPTPTPLGYVPPTPTPKPTPTPAPPPPPAMPTNTPAPTPTPTPRRPS